MSIETPRIDTRNQEVIAQQLRKLILHYCPEWQDVASIRSDELANPLAQIFSRMMEIIIQRLNRVPDKNFLTFLDLVGVRLNPPGIAQAPLVFTLSEGSTQYGHVPSGTQVSSTQKDEQGDIVFESAKDLTVILPKLVRALSLDPLNDRYRDHTTVFFSDSENNEEIIFEGKDLIPHRLFLGHANLFSFEEEATITLTVTLREDVSIDDWEVKWYCYTGDQEETRELTASGTAVNLLTVGDITFQNVTGIAEKTLTGYQKGTGEKKNWTSNWIFAELRTPLPQGPLPEIDTIQTSVHIAKAATAGSGTIKSVSEAVSGSDTTIFTEELIKGDFITANGQTIVVISIQSDNSLSIGRSFENDLTVGTAFSITHPLNADLAFCNIMPLDLSKDFYPFGEKPQFNDTLYIGSQEVFSKEGAAIRIGIILSEGLDPPDTTDIRLRWEFLNTNGWHLLGETTHSGVTDDQGPYRFNDYTNSFTRSGQVEFDCPMIEPVTINGEKNHWIRIRIVGGDYGKEATYREQTVDTQHEVVLKDGVKQKIVDGNYINLAGEKTEWVYIPPTFKPPSIVNFAISYTFIPEPENLQTVLTYNDFLYEDQTTRAQTPSEISMPAQPIPKVEPPIRETRSITSEIRPIFPGKTINYFTPYYPVEDTHPTLYFAFDKDITTLPVTLLFPLAANIFSLHQATQIQTPPVVAWEYWTGKEWSILSLEDKTDNLTRGDIVEFAVPNDIAKRPLFEEERFWVRIRLDQGVYPVLPKLSTINTNAVWAQNTVTLKDEILGSSNGEPGQVFNFSYFPVLPDQIIIVRETALTEAEREAITAEEGADAIQEIRDDADNVIELGVRWHEVKNFYFSEAGSRHYTIDRNSGRIAFGDGKRGLIPVAGKNNIKCTQYQYGGGLRGNVHAQTLTKLRTTIPYIDSVMNPTPAEGGFDQENLDNVRIRGPQTIKHRDRAITYEDFEWLVREASPKIARVKCLPTTDTGLQFSPGWVTIIVVPESDDAKPLPSQQLLRNIENYLYQRTSTYLTLYPSQIKFIGPSYIQVQVDASVAYTSISEAKIIEGRIIGNLKKFFHPLHGGPEEKGWDFGRNVYISEVYEVIEKTEGVDYVHELLLHASVQEYQLTLAETTKTLNTFPRSSSVTTFTTDGEVMLSLAEGIPLNTEMSALAVIGFREGDTIILGSGDDAIELIIKSVFGGTLECKPVHAEMTEIAYPPFTAVRTTHERIKSYTLEEVPAQSITCSLSVRVFEAGDSVVLKYRDDSLSVEIDSVSDQVETIFIEDNYLVYSGTHTIGIIE